MVIFRKILPSSAAAHAAEFRRIYRQIHSESLADRELTDELDERRGFFSAEFNLIAGVLKKLLPWWP